MISLTENDGASLLDELKFGHEANPPLNARQVDDDGDIEERMASIRSKGLLHALVITRRDRDTFVVDGNRRLKALRRMADMGEIPSGMWVPTREVPYNFAFEASLAANIERRAMHPVDEFEAFARLAHDGISTATIATRFGWTEKAVKQRLALGNLHPEIRFRWRAGILSEEQARAFTSEPAPERQQAIYEKLVADGLSLEPWRIRDQIAAGAFTTSKGFRFVGMEAYVFAGGRVREDLFGAEPIVLDPEILTDLVKEKLEEEMSVLRASGWAWAKMFEDLARDAYGWPRLSPATQIMDEEANAEIAILEERQHMAGALSPIGRAIEGQIEDVKQRSLLTFYTKAEKSGCGVIMRLRDDGLLIHTVGVQMPGPRLVKPQPENQAVGLSRVPSPDEIEAEQDRALPQLLSAMVARWQTQAIATTIMESGFRRTLWILAVATARPSAIAVFLRPDGAMEGPFLGLDNAVNDSEFILNLEPEFEFASADDSYACEHISAAVAAAVDTSRWISARNGGVPSTEAAVIRLLNMLPVELYNRHARERFDPDQYFVNARRVHSEQALKEMGVVNIPAASAPKVDVARMAITHARLFGWVPEGLRHPQKKWTPG